MAVPVITVAQMREWEQATWATGITEQAVIQRVGKLVAQRAMELTQPGDLMLILAGKGHNGDDARMALPHIAGRPVKLLNVTDPAAALREFDSLIRTQQPALLVDALFGIGLNRPLAGAWCDLVRAVNDSRVPVLAVDVPSGLNADTGEPQGAVVRATITLTLGAPKEGLLRTGAVEFVGRLEVAPDIGLVACPVSNQTQWTLPEDFSGFPPRRPAGGHKGTFGHVVIVAGSVGYHGAAVLAARGAQHARPGLVTVVTTAEAYVPVASQLQGPMVHPWRDDFALPETCTAVVFGPGLANPQVPSTLKAFTTRLWHEARVPVVADASGLSWLPEGPVNPETLRVITPHPGEAARLLKTTTAEVQANRLAAVQNLSRQLGRSWVVLKGRHTLLGQHTGCSFVNGSGNPSLAQGGAGDVLAGFLGGLLAQPALQTDVSQTIRYAVWEHGAAADRLETRSRDWTIEELCRELGAECA